jgi:hypothetical protein
LCLLWLLLLLRRRRRRRRRNLGMTTTLHKLQAVNKHTTMKIEVIAYCRNCNYFVV